MTVIRCPGVQGERGVAHHFRFAYYSSSLDNGRWAMVLASAFDNGWIMIVLEHMAGHSQSAADQIVANGLKNDYNSLDGKELNW